MLDEKIIYESLKADYCGIEMVSRKDAAKILGISTVTLDRMKKDGVGVEYKRIGEKVLYPIYALAIYISNVQQTFAMKKTLTYKSKAFI
jgi:hypothetical protein